MGKRGRSKLSAKEVEAFKGPGCLYDGAGLELEISPKGYARWCFRYSFGGKQRRLMLGSGTATNSKRLTLLDARQARDEAANNLKSGIDPKHINSASAKREAEKYKAAIPKFGEFAFEFVEALKLPKKAKQPWELSLLVYAKPLHSKSINDVTVTHVGDVLAPLWTSTPETARRTRSRIEAVFRSAVGKSFRNTDTLGRSIHIQNPAIWKGVLDSEPRLQTRSKRNIKKVQHHAAMPFQNVAGFMTLLSPLEGHSAKALQFVILTAARTGEAIGCKWSEFDLESELWTVPGDRMKAGETHIVPLSKPALALLKAIPRLASSPYVFHGAKPNQPLSNMALLMQLRRMKVEFTAHGFRSSFRTWAAECTQFPREIAEMALAHKVGNEVERAYSRTTLIEKRRALMNAWASYLEPRQTGNVVAIRTSTA